MIAAADRVLDVPGRIPDRVFRGAPGYRRPDRGGAPSACHAPRLVAIVSRMLRTRCRPRKLADPHQDTAMISVWLHRASLYGQAGGRQHTALFPVLLCRRGDLPRHDARLECAVPPRRAAAAARHAGRSVMDFSWLPRYLPLLIEGFWRTIALMLISGILGTLLAVPVALAQVSGGRILGGLSRGLPTTSAARAPRPDLSSLFGVGDLLSHIRKCASPFLWPYLRGGLVCGDGVHHQRCASRAKSSAAA